MFQSQSLGEANPFYCLAQSGNFFSAASSCNKSNGSWILDSSATNHKTSSSSQLFSSYKPCAGNQKVKIANSFFAIVAWRGTIMSYLFFFKP